MSDKNTHWLALSPSEQQHLQKTVGRVKSVTEFLSEVMAVVKGSDLLKAVAEALPWAAVVGEAIAEAVPPVKFLIKLFDGLGKELDPEKLGYLACTMAYERSVEQALSAIGAPKTPRSLTTDMRQALDLLTPAQDLRFSNLSFGMALAHPFIKDADQFLAAFADAVGYEEEKKTRLLGEVHVRFVANLKTILSHGKLKEKFSPFTEQIKLGSGEQQAYEALFEHADYQRWLFEEAPVLGKEPFALAQVYVETECGQLTWGNIRDGIEASGSDDGPERKRRIDPFDEQWGGRHPLLVTVMGLLGREDFNDAVVIQGVAGSGKSAFTLRLCSQLVSEGLRPIRIRLRDLRFDRPVLEALSQAVRLSDDVRGPEKYPRPDDLFLGGNIFKESLLFRNAVICPYVLILDGWDEISISVSDSFKQRVDKMLEALRNEYLRDRGVRVRIILTGRPSTAISESMFLQQKTPILTVRSLNPEHLRSFISDLHIVLRNASNSTSSGEKWQMGDIQRFESIFERYEADFARLSGQSKNAQHYVPPKAAGSMDVLGLPLLAHIAVRLLSRWEGDLAKLIANPTSLYRYLVDLTCEKSGQLGSYDLDPTGRPRIAGRTLRTLLGRTAVAMTNHGQESISHDELECRLGLQGGQLDTRVRQADDEHALTSLMISFYFKGGHRELGCEFVHKSFREYLFAEAVVEVLKEYGRKAREPLGERAPYWKEFDSADPRHNLCRQLFEMLSAQWLSAEIAAHLEELLNWEINRQTADDRGGIVGLPTEILDVAGWTRVRDGLADLWDYWADGVHLRPQPRLDRRGKLETDTPYVLELIDQNAPRILKPQELPPLVRTQTIDSSIGDALLRLCANVHYMIALRNGWRTPRGKHPRPPRPAEMWFGVSDIGKGPRRYQTRVRHNQNEWRLFAPAGKNSDFYANFVARINGAGWRPSGSFPLGVNMSGVDLRGAQIAIAIPHKEPTNMIWSHANLSGSVANGGLFYKHTALEILAKGLDAFNAIFDYAKLKGSDLTNARLSGASLTRADLSFSDLTNVSLRGANLEIAQFKGAEFKKTKFQYVRLEGAMIDIKRARSEGAEVEHIFGSAAPVVEGPEGPEDPDDY